MSAEQQLINKEYFENLTKESSNHPIEVLGELYLEENKKEIVDFSNIRFAQGEVYFHHKDFEAAIFKWENINNELGPWAKKNMADAYMELGLNETAEGIYLSVEPVHPALKIEINLQLLSIYIEQGKFAKATEVINEAVALDPDYPELTEIARSLFEENKDWDQAVQLASAEAVRTSSISWFMTLKSYIDEGYTISKEPDYFNEVLTALFTIDRRKFEQLVVSLWQCFKGTGKYHVWVKNFNTLFLELEVRREDLWQELPKLYQETYLDLVDGTHLIKEISPMVPAHLTNWLRIANRSMVLFASASVMAWSEMFPMSIATEVVREAEQLILNAHHYPEAKEDSLRLFDTVSNWASVNGIDVGHILKWIVEELSNQQSHRLLVVGASESGKSDFVNQLMGEPMLSEPTSSVVSFKYGTEKNFHKITDTDITEMASDEEFQEATCARRENYQKETVIQVQLPNEILRSNDLNVIDTPSINRKIADKHPFNAYLHFADGLLFILNAAHPLTEKEREILKQVSIQAPNLPVHFVLNKIETLASEQEFTDVYEKTLVRIRSFYPQAKLLAFPATDSTSGLVEEFSQFIHSTIKIKRMNREQVSRLQYFVGRSIQYLLDKRIEKENTLIENVHWNEEMVSKLKGAINQVHDLEDEKKHSIKNAFVEMKDELKSEMLEEIPKILRESAELIKEDSDLGKIHLQLNQEMNDRVHEYLEKDTLGTFYTSLQSWISLSKDEFDQAQFTLSEMSAGFNAMYGEERFIYECDFKVLDDWRRDADRMTSGIELEEFNFFLRFTPGQFLLKSAGRLLAALPKNNPMLYNKYKSYLENKDYHELAVMITSQFFKQFELFEKTIERDVSLFFRAPLDLLDQTVEEAYQQIESSKEELEKMRVKPELYRDPLNLFEVRLRQYEWMAAAGKDEY